MDLGTFMYDTMCTSYKQISFTYAIKMFVLLKVYASRQAFVWNKDCCKQ